MKHKGFPPAFANAERVEDILETLASLGQARSLLGEKYVAS